MEGREGLDLRMRSGKARHKTIGVAVRCLGGFRVFFSDSDYRKLENRIFPNARAVIRSVDRFAPAA